jgi:hypothetical protein
MYSIIVIIILIIILTEIYCIFKNKSVGIEKLNKEIVNNEIPVTVRYNEYLVKGDKIIKHKPGYIYVKENFNLFIKEKNNTLLAKKNKVYKFNTDFTVEILDVNGKNTVYYYITTIHNNPN